jgi:dipeptidyl aminopeptidase/acylaminoacyl peptidase
MRFIAFAPAAALLAAPTLHAEPHPFSAADLVRMERVSDPQPSPDGSQIAFVVRETDMEADRGRTDIWLIAADGGPVRRLTSSEAADRHPRWSPDGRALFFLSSRSGASQVWRLPLSGGEAAPVTDLEGGVDNLIVFPDGERILFTREVLPGERPEPPGAEATSSARAWETLPIRHWDTWEDDLRSHVFVWRIGSADPPLDLMSGWDVDSPTRPFGGVEELAVSPDGEEVVFVAKRSGREAMWSTNTDLWSVPADASAEPRNLTSDNPASDTLPAFSPDGRFLAWAAMRRPGFEADRLGLRLLDRASGERRELAPDWDRSVAEIAWRPDSSGLLVSALDVGNRSIFALDLTSSTPRRLIAEGDNSAPAGAAWRVVYLHDDLGSPAEIWTAGADGSNPSRLTEITAERMAGIAMGAHEAFSFAGWNGETVHGFVVKPAGYREGERYPVAFLIHGGPQGSFSNHFHYRWNPQTYAGAGYAVVTIDFHGSVGYGQAFTDSISGDWGGKPYEDLMKGLDAALARYSFLDGERVSALGASYGGYMINWIAGHTDRFRCLVNHDGVFDTRSMYYETEELWFVEWENDGAPWESPEAFERFNPVRQVGRWKTPMLVVQGAFDFRVPESQGVAAFTALQRRGVPSRLLHFPDENHWVLKPGNSLRWHAEVLAWLERWSGARDR